MFKTRRRKDVVVFNLEYDTPQEIMEYYKKQKLFISSSVLDMTDDGRLFYRKKLTVPFGLGDKLTEDHMIVFDNEILCIMYKKIFLNTYFSMEEIDDTTVKEKI